MPSICTYKLIDKQYIYINMYIYIYIYIHIRTSMYTTSLHFTRERKSKADTCEKKAWAMWLERSSFSNSS